MSEIQRRDAHADGDPGAALDADRDAKIEQLLLAGLDYYFSAQYEQAINVWTRALFFDRNHARARAYIERARSALAERQRESEELLQNGVAAFHRGEADEARRLLQAAIEGGAPAEEALAVLDRLNRLETAASADSFPRTRREAPAAHDSLVARRPRSGLALVAGTALGLAILAIGGYLSSTRIHWQVLLPAADAPAAAAAPIAQDLSLPLPRRGEIAVTRARELAAGGHLHDALAVLAGVRATDPQRGDADRLRADIQRQLLALTALPDIASSDRDPSERRVP
jgi:tetratricopeptide (TPR) repeat protein